MVRRIADGSYLIAVWSPDGTQIAAISQTPEGRQLVVMNADGTDSQTLVELDTDDFTGIAWHPDGRQIVYASMDHCLRVLSIEEDQEGMLLRGHRNRVASLAFSQDGTRLAALVSAASASGVAEDYTLKVWNTDTGQGEPILTHELPRQATQRGPAARGGGGFAFRTTPKSLAFVDAECVVSHEVPLTTTP